MTGETARAPVLAMTQRWRRMTLWLVVLMFAVEAGFMLLVTTEKPLLAVPVFGPLNVGLLLGTLATIAGWGIACFYVLWANRAHKQEAARGIAP